VLKVFEFEGEGLGVGFIPTYLKPKKVCFVAKNKNNIKINPDQSYLLFFK